MGSEEEDQKGVEGKMAWGNSDQERGEGEVAGLSPLCPPNPSMGFGDCRECLGFPQLLCLSSPHFAGSQLSLCPAWISPDPCVPLFFKGYLSVMLLLLIVNCVVSLAPPRKETSLSLFKPTKK